MLKHRYEDVFKFQAISSRYPAVSHFNAPWLLFRIGRAAQINKDSAGTIKSEYLHEWILPETLKSSMSDKPSFTDCCIFENIMRLYIKYLTKQEEELGEGSAGSIRVEGVVRSIIDTEIIVDDGEVLIKSRSGDLLKYLKQELATDKDIVVLEIRNLGWNSVERDVRSNIRKRIKGYT